MKIPVSIKLTIAGKKDKISSTKLFSIIEIDYIFERKKKFIVTLKFNTFVNISVTSFKILRKRGKFRFSLSP